MPLLPIEGSDGKATRFINYERQSGFFKYFTNFPQYKKAFQGSNEGLKRVCEEEEEGACVN